MKTYLFILGLASAVSVQANALNLYDSLKGSGNGSHTGDNLEENNGGWKNETDRSLSRHFFIKVEGSLLLLSTDKQMDDFSIQIEDAQGRIVYTESYLSLPAEGVYPIVIGDWADGQYTAVLRQGVKQIVCRFTK